MSQIEIMDILKIYTIGDLNIRAVDNVSMKIEKGEFYPVVGHSGSGPLISIMGGIIRPTTGRVLFEGIDISSLNDENYQNTGNEKIGFMFQFASLLPILTAKENVLLPRIFSRRKIKRMVKRQRNIWIWLA